MKNVMLAAPSYDGKVSVWHAAALSETCKLGLTKDINIFPIYMSFDSLVQRARNDIFKLAYKSKVDELVFIDCDQDWNPEDFFKLLEHEEDVVGCPVRKKSDIAQFNIKLVSKDYELLENGLVEVDSVGTGFMKISKNAIVKIWESSEEYIEIDKQEKSRMVFDIGIHDGILTSEDVVFCEKWRNMGGKVYIDPTINSGHSGEKRWVGNFEEWIKAVQEHLNQMNSKEEIMDIDDEEV